jgi:hypothetical protein
MWRRPMCKCLLCRKARSDYVKAYKAERAQRLAADPSLAEHGTNSTYNNRNCRCDACRAAHSAYLAQYRAPSELKAGGS